ncbi:MAG TPA: hypothetical protein VFY65_02930 [Longimicrobium sp.]|nr:hypothetical protein [Longimicrobium sp.]
MRHGEMERTRSTFLAIHAYYTCLAGLAGRAIKRATIVPEVPALDELEVVDGWVVRNGRPVWRVDDGKFTGAQLGWTGLPISAARSAWAHAAEYRLQATQEFLDHTAECLEHVNHAPERKARLFAEIGFYGSLLEEYRLALRGKAPFPVVPETKELEFVGGWLMWNGEPVWWSGERDVQASASPSPVREDSAPSRPPAPARPRLRRLLALPWRRAAA